VTDQRLADEALRESRQRLAATYEAVPVGIAEVDEAGRFMRVNDAMAAISGFSPDELLGRRFIDITHPDDRGFDADCYSRQVRGEVDRYALQKHYTNGPHL
jgi:PAS domain S-box-containing protein